MRRVVAATGKHEVLGLQRRLLDPTLQSVTSGLRDVELHRTLCLVLHDPRSRLVVP